MGRTMLKSKLKHSTLDIYLQKHGISIQNDDSGQGDKLYKVGD